MDKKYDVVVQGMTCHSCEVLVEMSWKDLKGVKSIKADSANGRVSLTADRDIGRAELQASLLDQKYKVMDGAEVPQEKWIKPRWSELVGLFALAIGLAWIITRLGGLVSGGAVTQNIGLGSALFLGLIASISSCLAVVSGLLISSTAGLTQASGKTGSRVVPVIMFLTGRVISYSVLGGILGWVGAKLAFSPTVTALILAAAAIYMVLVGLDMLHLLPATIRRYLPGTPKRLAHGVLDKAQQSGIWLPAAMGAATFFLPCGFTQALQAFALTTGSFVTSAAILGTFALGTVPGLLAFGLATTAFKGKAGKFILKVAGALVIVLGLLNLRNGIALADITFPPASWKDASTYSAVTPVPNAERQVVRMKVTADGYTPDQITIKAGVPVRWEVDATEARGCNGSLVSRQLGINAVLEPKINVFEFTPDQKGTIAFSCSMGMYRGSFLVE